jgi:hypothetical protein
LAPDWARSRRESATAAAAVVVLQMNFRRVLFPMIFYLDADKYTPAPKGRASVIHKRRM